MSSLTPIVYIYIYFLFLSPAFPLLFIFFFFLPYLWQGISHLTGVIKNPRAYSLSAPVKDNFSIVSSHFLGIT